MTLPKVHVMLTADGRGEVWINEQKLPAVLAVTIRGEAGEMPRVQVEVRPGELTVDLPETGVQLLTTVQGSAVEFLGSLNARELQATFDAEADMATPPAHGLLAILAGRAAEFDDRR